MADMDGVMLQIRIEMLVTRSYLTSQDVWMELVEVVGD